MEDRRYVILILLLVAGTLTVFPRFVNAYSDTTTHPALTSETVKLFNRSYPAAALSDEERGLLMQGSTNEDKGTRALQHFYDPVYNRGLTIGTEWQKSKDWAEDTLAQASYNLNSFSNPIAGAFYGTVKEFYSSDTDHSWERAIYEYTWGDRKRGLESLGHILHLLQDASVPDHTRNDPHPPVGEFGSPYESWTKQFTSENIKISRAAKMRPILILTLNEHFDDLANYSNGNFFSKDTIFSPNYSNPSSQLETREIMKNGKKVIFSYSFDGTNNFRLVGRFSTFDWQDAVGREYFIKDPDHLILSGYWSLLSTQAVLHGAGVIKLFFDEVEKERATKRLYNKNRTLLQKFYDKAAEKIYNLATNFYGGSVLSGLIDKSIGTGQPAAVAQMLQNQSQPTESKQSTGEDGVAAPSLFVEKSVDKSAQGRSFLDLSTDAVVEENDARGGIGAIDFDEAKYNATPSPHQPGFGGGGGAWQGTQETDNESSDDLPTPQGDTTPPETPIVTTPSTNPWSSVTNAVSFSGTAEASSLLTATYLADGAETTATTTVSENTLWTIAQTFGQGTTTVSFTATDATGNVSSATTSTVFIDSSAPDISLSADVCSNALATSTSSCLVAATAMTFSWSSSANDIAYYSLNQNGVASTTAGVSFAVTIADNAEYTLGVSAIDTLGNASATSTKTIRVSTAAVVVNEIAWMGTASSSDDEWIELYNRTESPIALTGWVLRADDGTPYLTLSGTIAAGGYYLIERTSDDTIRDIAADLVVPFSGTGGGSGLGNTGERLYLERASGGATTTIDTVAYCSNWCAGANISSQTRLTMERYDATAAGADSSNWATALGEFVLNGEDAGGNAVKGTPRAKNSVSYLVAPTSTLSESKTLTASNSPYLVGREGLTISSGATLTLGEGVVIKIVEPDEPSIFVNGALIANGTASSSVIITAFADDEYGGDMNGDGTSTAPASGSWKKILFSSASGGSSLSHTMIRYGGRWTTGDTLRAMVVASGVSPSFTSVTFENAKKHGLYLLNSDSVISSSTFQNNTTDTDASGLYISGGSPTVSGSTFAGNRYGVSLSDAPNAALSSNTFTDNSAEAVDVVGTIGALSGNSGSGNGLDAIVIGNNSAIAGAAGTTTLAANSLPYLIVYEARVASGAILAVNDGVVVKGHDSLSSQTGRILVQSGGQIYAGSSSASSIVFTSMHDDSVGGAVDTATTSPAAGDWYGIVVQDGGIINMSGFTLRYGGALTTGGGDDKGGLKILSTATSTIARALIENNYQYGMRLDGAANVSVSDTTIRNHTEKNIGMTAAGVYAENTSVSLSDITFFGNEVDVKGVGSNTISCTNCGSPTTDPADLLP